MPLSPLPTDTPEQLAKAETVREKILSNFVSKYLFNVRTNHVPKTLIVENDRLVGLVFQETRIENGRAIPVPGTETEVRGPYVISSIGSIPEMIEGIPARGVVYDIGDEAVCRIAGYPNVFALGNAVTGRGNINESLKHGRDITQKLIAEYIEDPLGKAAENGMSAQKDAIARAIDGIVASIDPITESSRQQLLQRISNLQAQAGYDDDFTAWVEKHRPVRLEEILGGEK
jgi:ferredoxin--NADP+ reductase